MKHEFARWRALPLAVMALSLLGAPSAADELIYTHTEISMLSGGSLRVGTEGNRANAINDLGHVVGRSDQVFVTNQDGQEVYTWYPSAGFLWRDSNGNGLSDSGEVVGLGLEPGVYPAPGQLFLEDANGINSNDQVVGCGSLSDGTHHALLWQSAADGAGGVVIDLGTLGDNYSCAYGINDLGQVVGESYTASGDTHAFLWQNGVMTDLGTLGGRVSTAYAINNRGQIVGESETADGNTRAFLWQNGVMTDLGTLGGSNSQARAINNKGQIVGEARLATGERHAFLWQNGVMTSLGTLGGRVSTAYGINDKGQVVGAAFNRSWKEHAFVWQPAPGGTSGVMTDLGPLGGSYSQAKGINKIGQIASFGRAYGVSYALRLTPPPSVSSDPPVTTAMLSGTAGDNDWYTSAVQVTLSATDPDGDEDVAETYYRVDGQTPQSYVVPFSVSGDGIHTVEFWSVDRAGNEEAHQSLTVKVDATPPQIVGSLEGIVVYAPYRHSGRTVDFSAQIAALSVTDHCDPNPVIAVSPASGSFFPLGTTPVVVAATDAAGNAASRSFPVTVGTPQDHFAVLASVISASQGRNRVSPDFLQTGLRKQLLARVAHAIATLDRGGKNAAKIAVNDLKVIIRQVEIHTPKRIHPAKARQILQIATEIMRDELGG